MFGQQSVDFVTYYDASGSHWLLWLAITIANGLVVLVIVTAILRRRRR